MCSRLAARCLSLEDEVRFGCICTCRRKQLAGCGVIYTCVFWIFEAISYPDSELLDVYWDGGVDA